MSITNIHSCKDITAIVKYCVTPKKKQESKRVAALYSDIGSAEDFLTYSNSMLKNTCRKIQGYVLLQSFSKSEFNTKDKEHIIEINELGKKLVRSLYPNSLAIVITHADSEGECLHNHIVVLNHDFATGKAITQNRRFCDVKTCNDKIMEKYGLEICQPSNTPKTQGEYWSDKRNGWLGLLRESVDEALAQSTSLQEFQEKLLVEGISSNVAKKNGELKEHFSFSLTDLDGKVHKKRSDSLGEEYSKKTILQRLQENKKQSYMEKIMPMSEWIDLQRDKEKNSSKKIDTWESNRVSVNQKVIMHIPIVEVADSDNDRKEEELVMKKQINIRMMREAEHQELLREIKKITLQIEAIKKIFEREEDSDADMQKLNQLESELEELKLQDFRLQQKQESDVPLNEKLMPSIDNVKQKDDEMSF